MPRYSMKTFLLTCLVLLILSITPEISNAEPSPEAKSLFKRAMELNNRQDYATALNYLMKAYQISPDILAENDQGLMDNATTFLRARVSNKPDDGEAHFQLAELLNLRGIGAEAAVHYKRVIALKPGGPLALLARGEVDKIEQEKQQLAAMTATTVQEAETPQESPQVRRLKDQIASLEEEVKSLKEKIKQARADEKDKFARYEKMEEDYKKLQKDSALWRLSYIKHMSMPGAQY